MKAKNKLLTILLLSTGAATATALINQGIKLSATSKNLLSKPDSLCYKWRLGNIHYTKSGEGKPLLLIHDLMPEFSGHEWDKMIQNLSQNYCVYVIDLLGCGMSEKPNITYTNYIYVQLLTDFIRSEIGHRTDVIASGASASFTIMACSLNPELFNRLLFINPESIFSNSLVPGKRAKFFKFILDTPIVGTLLYHIAVSKKSLRERFSQIYFNNPYSVREEDINLCYESAHLGTSPKSIYASVQCYYTKCNIVNALKKIDNSIYLIGGNAIHSIEERLKEYKLYNAAIEYSCIDNVKTIPQLEAPDEVLKIIEMYFN
ncbi:MAG: alpha/beta hydrolase [Lachnospiraceae bacterium]